MFTEIMTILWLIIAALSSSDARKFPSNRNKDLLDVIKEFANVMASSYLSDARCISVITSGPAIQISFTGLPVLNIAHNGNETHFDISILNAINAGCPAFVFQTEDVKWMVEKYSELTRSPRAIHRSNNRFIFFPKNVTDRNSSWETAIDEAFTSRCMNWMPDLLAVHFVEESEAMKKLKQVSYKIDKDLDRKFEVEGIQRTYEDRYVLEVYTHRFVGEHPSERVLLDVWIPGYGFAFCQELFPNKVRNLMGKELTISSLSYPPFTLMRFDIDPPVFAGIDFQVWFEFAKKHNCKWNIVLDLENWWGEIWENGSGNGLAGAIVEDRADFAFSALYMFQWEFLNLDFSVVYQRTGITVVAPRPKPLPGWLIPSQPFSNYMWLAVLFSILGITITLYVVSNASRALLGGNISSYYSTMLECGFRTVGLLVLQVPEDERDYATPRHVSMRHLVTWLILFFLVVASAYGGGLSSILTVPQFEPPIDTIEDLAKSGLHWAALEPAFTTSLEGSSNPAVQTVVKNFIALSIGELVARAFDDIALAVERLQDHYAEVEYIFEEMMEGKRLMKDDLYYGHCAFELRKGSPYKKQIDDMLLRLRETGILFYWEGMTVREHLSERRQLSVMQSRTISEAERVKLGLYHVQGGFYLLALGLSIALVVLVLEVLVFHHLQKRQNARY